MVEQGKEGTTGEKPQRAGIADRAVSVWKKAWWARGFASAFALSGIVASTMEAAAPGLLKVMHSLTNGWNAGILYLLSFLQPLLPLKLHFTRDEVNVVTLLALFVMPTLASVSYQSSKHLEEWDTDPHVGCTMVGMAALYLVCVIAILVMMFSPPIAMRSLGDDARFVIISQVVLFGIIIIAFAALYLYRVQRRYLEAIAFVFGFLVAVELLYYLPGIGEWLSELAQTIDTWVSQIDAAK